MSKASASGLDPEGEAGMTVYYRAELSEQSSERTERRITDLNPLLAAAIWNCDSSHNPVGSPDWCDGSCRVVVERPTPTDTASVRVLLPANLV